MSRHAGTMRKWGLTAFAWLMLAANATAQTTTVEYIHTDALGSPVATTNASAVVLERQVYEPYGSQISHGPTDVPGFTGHVEDSLTSLDYMQQRYYDAQIAAFLSVDPVEADSDPEEAFNRYRYANGNPYRFLDPDGRSAKDQWYGLGDSDFRDWVHDEKQSEGRRHDYTKKELEEKRKQWEKEGKPRGKGGRSGRGGFRRGQEGYVRPQLLVRAWVALYFATYSAPLNESEDRDLINHLKPYNKKDTPVPVVTVGDVAPVAGGKGGGSDSPSDSVPKKDESSSAQEARGNFK